MLRVRVSTASAEIIETELITAGRRGLECGFEFNSAWDGLAKTVIVNGVVKRDIVLVSDTITVPGECLAREQFPLRIGVYGANGAGEIVIPTIWANFGKILPSARPSGVDPDEVTPDVVAQIQSNSSNALMLAQEVMRRADSGEFDGRDGATGPSGEDGRDGAPGSSIWWAPTSARIVDAFVTLERLSGRSGIPPQIGDLVFFEDYEVYVIAVVGQYRAAINRLGSIIGPKGDQGDAFTYEDFTEAQLAALTGPQGPVGPAGNPGEDGFSPVVTVTTITGGHQVSITDAQGTETFDVMDGPAGPSGGQFWTAQSASTLPDYTWSFSNLIGPDDETPAVGDIIFYSIYRYTVASVDLQNQKVTCTARTSLRGPQGPAGQGVPVGGDQAQILSKKSGTDYDTQWSDLIALVPSTFKAALLQLAQKVAYIDDQGQTYYQDLYDALYPPKELVSISAVFTQDQTVVYDTDSLDNLKSMLVVTGTYDDQSTETIPSTGYTLSGTLTPGTSTITVTCDGKTTTFTVQVTHQPGVYAVTNNLSGCSNSNTAASVTEGGSYSGTITASAGYTLTGATVSITMGGTDITGTAYSNGTISIASVTGALVITVTAVAVTLSSISAVYTQSGTVYDTDTLDSLKADLVVTAHYSDSSTAIVPAADYTLSGTLTVGTSTITVSYGGKTATFEVTVKSSAPPAYALYIPATNTGKLVTSLGKDATNKITKIVFDCSLPVYSSMAILFKYGSTWAGVNSGAWDGGLKTSATPAYSEIAGQGRATVTFDISTNGASYLELRSWSNNHPEMTIYGFDVYSGDTLQGSLRPTSTVGEMTDSVSGSTINWTDTTGMTVTEVE